jgi:hypothetical protein
MLVLWEVYFFGVMRQTVGAARMLITLQCGSIFAMIACSLRLLSDGLYFLRVPGHRLFLNGVLATITTIGCSTA